MLATLPSATAATRRQDFELGGLAVACGAGLLAELPAACAELGLRRVFLVADPGIMAAGHGERALALLRDAGLEATAFDALDANPTSADVGRASAAAVAWAPDGLVALGGGSALDVAKGVNFLLSNGGRMEDYWGDGKAEKPMLPSIAVPTTAGTGSEAQRFAVIAAEADGRKMACGDRKARFRKVLLDPELLGTVPRVVVATAGLDALSHAVESYVSRTRGVVSQMLSRKAFELLDGHFAAHLADRGDLEAAEAMLLGAHLAGAAIEASMLGCAHACANPLTTRYGVTHGAAVALMLPAVLRFNAEESAIAALYRELRPTGELAARLEALRNLGGLPKRLREVDVPESDLPLLAADAHAQWTARHNPRPVAVADLLYLYREAF